MKIGLFTCFGRTYHTVFILTIIAININIACFLLFLVEYFNYFYLFGSIISWQNKIYLITYLHYGSCMNKIY